MGPVHQMGVDAPGGGGGGVAQRLADLGDEVEGLPPVQLISLFLHILRLRERNSLL